LYRESPASEVEANSKKFKKLVHFLTIHQWREIDREYKRSEEFDLKGLAVVVAVVFVLIFQQYFGKSDFIRSFEVARRFFGETPWPKLMPKLYWALFNICNYFLIPVIIIKTAFKEKIVSYGFHLEKKKSVLILYLVMFMVVFPLVYIVSFSPAFLSKYPFYKQAANSWSELLLWEGAYGVQFLALEFFFRGFILFALARYIGVYAIFFMVVPYTMIHFSKPLPETIGAIITGIALGTLALKTKSIYGGVLIHIAVAWSMDIFSLLRKGFLQKLLGID